MRSPRFVVLVVLALGAVSALPRVARADDAATKRSERHYHQGDKLFALGKFSEALVEFQKAFDAKPIPDFLFNIGQCYRNLGDYDSAIFTFKKYLKLDPDTEKRDAVEKLIDDLEAKKAHDDAKHLGFGKKPPPDEPVEHEGPVYSKWWFWTGVAVVGVAGGFGIYEATKSDGPPATTLGNIVIGK